MLTLLSKFKVYVVLSVIILTMCAVISYQKKEISLKSKLIAQIDEQSYEYKETIRKIEEDRGRVKTAFDRFNTRQSRIDTYFDELERELNEEYDRQTWDEQKVPASIVCYISCVQQDNREKCNCATDGANGKLPRVL